MARATWILAATSVAACATSAWLYLDNRDLREQLGVRPTAVAAASEDKAAARTTDPWTEPNRSTSGAAPRGSSATPPQLPETKEAETIMSRLERRQRRQAELIAMLGRLDGETEEEYRNRMVPLITAGLLVPRARVEEMRREVEAKAGVTPEQSKKLDAAFDKVYTDTLDYANKAIADGTLSPYERNVSGWLEFAGGLGGILGDANSQIGQILSPQQVKSISSSGFEWGEYLGAKAPWEKLAPPPPPK